MDNLLTEIVQKITAHIDPAKIILFGSRARGNYRPDSDYDLVIVYDGPMSKREVDIGIRGLFRPPNFALDLLVLTTSEIAKFKDIANTLEREVTENGVIIYG
ncbi:MAG: nucleotidyltransferase domain-containing protein [Candidatus Hatepunaea meridiana]|nr:nucleotidyltransferase domain-containing protein [Candidatus Hatepunaea meridiana]